MLRCDYKDRITTGPPQPSIVYRSLRQLEPSMSSPALHLAQTACQNHAKQFIADLFDSKFFQLDFILMRLDPQFTIGMFSLGGRGTSHFGLAYSTSANTTTRTARYFLHCDMYDQVSLIYGIAELWSDHWIVSRKVTWQLSLKS